MADLKRRRKSISLKIEHLRLELEEREEAIRVFEKEFLDALSSLETEQMDRMKYLPILLIILSVPRMPRSCGDR